MAQIFFYSGSDDINDILPLQSMYNYLVKSFFHKAIPTAIKKARK